MDFQRLFDILAYQQSKYPQKKALCARDTRGKEWKCWNTSEAIEKIDALSIGMLKNGFKRGEKVALIAQNGSPSWNFVDLAAQQIACVVIPVYTTMSENDFDFIVKDADIKYYFFGAEQIYQKFCSKLPPTAKSWALGNESIADLPSWEQLAKFVMTNEYRNEINRIKAEISNDSIATIIYTSGTTGHPKGVMLSHRNIISNIISTITLVPTKCGDRVVSFLPLSHIFERMVTYTYMAAGLNIYYISDIRLALKEIKEVRPRFFTTVPLWLNRIYDQILIRNSKRPLILRKIFDWAINVGLQYKLNSYFPFLYWIKLFIADVLVFQWWRLTLGGKLRGIIVGAAALDVKLIRLFAAAGIHVREGYGLTETSPVVSFNRFHAGGVKFGTVGIPIPGVEVKIFEPDENGEGEIWVKGENVMKGYFNLPLEATHQVLTSDGWFKTGDIGKWVHKRFLKITDRRKDIFKTSSGRFVAPQPIEILLNSSQFIESSMIYGFNRPFVVALILPDFEGLEQWCFANRVHWTAPEYMILNPKVLKLYNALIEQVNTELQNHEKIKKFLLISDKWTPELGQLTPTMKIRRNVIEDTYQAELDSLYD